MHVNAILSHDERVRLLSDKSVDKRFDAYRDVGWDEPGMEVRHDDPRWILSDDDPLGRTDWYRALPEAMRARIGLHVVVRQLKVGVQFENILSRGLLELASVLPHDAPELRYAYHEIIEESQHSLMFLELLRRAGLPVRGIGPVRLWMARGVPRLARSFPELFLVHVLAGEEPIDRVQRRALRNPERLHPLLERIMRIHVIEEARHVCFARSYLRENVPRLPTVKRLRLRIGAPLVLAATADQMLRLGPEIVGAYRIPRAVVAAHHHDPEHRVRVLEGLEPVRRLCLELGIVTPALVPWWRALGVWPDGAERVPRLPAPA
jgi:hypothetical protein